ncbi:MAG TPA: ankyrin repeat domain-containing protein [Pyrinomonadaceae bacterium]|nr:ankyrin repeat domain-containing protein [Pyrinomonadaceae bacterium]
MAAVGKQFIGSEVALWDLWRVAETGEVNQLERVLERAGDVNARNKHGMTALMRAAHQGHEPMVRALLRHGADPNLTRNDKFTALALAAFFGHTDTVRTLIEHGAKTEVVTRCNTSAYMWANARTFSEAARCLKSYQPARDLDREPARPAAPAVKTAEPLVVKTLKEPPEIWELVHEEPKGFNPRSAFASRLKSTSVAFRIAAVVLVSATCLVGAWVLKGSQARSLPEAAVPQNVPEAIPVVPQAAPLAPETVVKTEPETPAPAVAEAPVALPPVQSVKPAAPRKMYSFTRQSAPRSMPNDGGEVQIVETKEEPVIAPPVVASPPVESPKPNKAINNPQPVAPARNTAPKAKVIQWP